MTLLYLCLVQTGDKKACHIAVFIHSPLLSGRDRLSCLPSEPGFTLSYHDIKHGVLHDTSMTYYYLRGLLDFHLTKEGSPTSSYCQLNNANKDKNMLFALTEYRQKYNVAYILRKHHSCRIRPRFRKGKREKNLPGQKNNFAHF